MLQKATLIILKLESILCISTLTGTTSGRPVPGLEVITAARLMSLTRDVLNHATVFLERIKAKARRYGAGLLKTIA